MPDPEFIDNTPELQEELEKAIQAALEAMGIQATSHVVQILTKDAYKNPVSWYHRTGAMKKFSHQVDMEKKRVYVGTNLSYAPYWEYGTGQYADGGGRKGYWVFVPGSEKHQVGGTKVYTEAEAKRIMAALRSQGLDAHMTNGIRPVHMLKRAIQDYKDEYQEILKTYLSDVSHPPAQGGSGDGD